MDDFPALPGFRSCWHPPVPISSRRWPLLASSPTAVRLGVIAYSPSGAVIFVALKHIKRQEPQRGGYDNIKYYRPAGASILIPI